MAHKTLINGTAYALTGGKTLVGGTVYSIKNGKTLINGAAFELPFSHDIRLTVTGSYHSSNCYYLLDGVKQTSGTSTYNHDTVLLPSQELSLHMRAALSSSKCTVTLNGVQVAANRTVDYTVELSGYQTVALVFSNPSYNRYACAITAS